jgi:ATP-binding cassette subfamily C protein LapB
LPVIGVFCIIVVSAYVLQHRLHELSQSTYQASAQRNATLVESLTGIETIKSQGAESQIQSRWERANQFLSTLNVRMRGLSSTAMYTTATLQQLVSVFIILIGVYLISDKALTMGGIDRLQHAGRPGLGACRSDRGPVDAVPGGPHSDGVAGADHGAAGGAAPTGSAFIQRRELKGEIEFRHVSFAYPGRKALGAGRCELQDQPRRAGGPDRQGGIGQDDAAKADHGAVPTHLEGAILLDGIDMRQLDPADVRRNLGYVSQDVTLFYGSLRENITFGMPHAQATMPSWPQPRAAGLAEFVQRHPQGFDMQVGERGELLSGGQRQGVGVARAVLHNAPLLLLDEPTSAMDFSTEAVVTQRMQAFTEGKTVVLVTHRTSMLSFRGPRDRGRPGQDRGRRPARADHAGVGGGSHLPRCLIRPGTQP